MDNLPVTWCYDIAPINGGEGREEYCSTGFPMGCYVTVEGSAKYPCPIQQEVRLTNWWHDPLTDWSIDWLILWSYFATKVLVRFFQVLEKKMEGYFVYNHVDLEVWFNPTKSDESTGTVKLARLVRVKVTPRSVDHAVSWPEPVQIYHSVAWMFTYFPGLFVFFFYGGVFVDVPVLLREGFLSVDCQSVQSSHSVWHQGAGTGLLRSWRVVPVELHIRCDVQEEYRDSLVEPMGNLPPS